jgi:SlyX protein
LQALPQVDDIMNWQRRTGALMTDSQTRLTVIETTLTHQDRLLDELNAVVSVHADTIDRLERQIAHIAERLATAEAELPSASANDPPPHW